MKNKNPTRCHLLLYCAYVMLNMFWAPLCPSSGAHDDSVWLPHRPSGSGVAAGWMIVAGRMDESCYSLWSNQQQLQNQKACVVTKRYRRELLMIGIMVPETC